MKRRLLLIATVFCLLLASCIRQPITPTPTATTTHTATPAATPTDSAPAVEYLHMFETVWQTINDEYFDPTFGGGFFEVRKALAEQLNGERVLFWSYKGRDSIREVYLEPARDAYTGPLVVLIDVMSLSSAEEFSGAMQAIDRAAIVGERSAGICVIADWMQLSNGATFMYPVGQTRVADGTALEGRGVIPDIQVELDRDLLLHGIDSQLEAAIDYVEEQGAR
jgi:hypothetical protein